MFVARGQRQTNLCTKFSKNIPYHVGNSNIQGYNPGTDRNWLTVFININLLSLSSCAVISSNQITFYQLSSFKCTGHQI